MAGLNFIEQVRENVARVKHAEQLLASGLMQPFSATNSGSRKSMHKIQRDHALPLLHGEEPIISTGYEERFGDLSSSIIKADKDYIVIAKISKFSFAPNHIYYLILRDINSNKLIVIKRKAHKFITEVYGYLYTNVELDKLVPGAQVPKGTILRKSLGYDEHGNKTDVINLNTIYLADLRNMEDSLIILDEIQPLFASPIFKPVTIPISRNNIPLNLYGTDDLYKSWPDVGEPIKDGILCGFRMEKKEEAAFSQSWERLKNVVMSDEKYTVNDGIVMDVDIYCNDPESLAETPYTSQLAMYYREKQRMAQEMVNVITPLVSQGFELDYELQKIFSVTKDILNGKPYRSKKPFSNTLDILVMEEKELNIGDKMCDRHGGKGVVSCSLPRKLMPSFPNGEPVHIIVNQGTMYGRENPGQLFEVSLTHIAARLLEYIRTGVLTPEESIDMVVKYLQFVAPGEAEFTKRYVDTLDTAGLMFYLELMSKDDCIYVSEDPMSECMNIDKLAAIYDEFPWAGQVPLEVPIVDSMGNIRRTPSRRKFICGKKAMYRLKQFAEEKFSVTSLSSTNLRNENTKSKASKNGRELYTNTPIKFGNMESGDMGHMGVDQVIAVLMIHSLSPHARRLVEQMYTGDPYAVDIKLDKDSSNRSVEILNTYLKAIGLRIRFIKKKKKIKHAVSFDALSFSDTPKHQAISFHGADYDYQGYHKTMLDIRENRKKRGISFEPVRFSWDDDTLAEIYEPAQPEIPKK